jgi:hypothetical protein
MLPPSSGFLLGQTVEASHPQQEKKSRSYPPRTNEAISSNWHSSARDMEEKKCDVSWRLTIRAPLTFQVQISFVCEKLVESLKGPSFWYYHFSHNSIFFLWRKRWLPRKGHPYSLLSHFLLETISVPHVDGHLLYNFTGGPEYNPSFSPLYLCYLTTLLICLFNRANFWTFTRQPLRWRQNVASNHRCPLKKLHVLRGQNTTTLISKAIKYRWIGWAIHVTWWDY